jgi:hypothetical protein
MWKGGLKYISNPNGPDFLQHGPAPTASWVRAARLPEVLLNRYLTQGEVATNGNAVKLERGSRRETGCL